MTGAPSGHCVGTARDCSYVRKPPRQITDRARSVIDAISVPLIRSRSHERGSLKAITSGWLDLSWVNATAAQA